MKYVIFGVTGFLGERLAEFLLRKGLHVVGVARNEGKLVALKEQFPKLEIITGDIADKWIVKKAMRGAYGVFLLSAVKGVDIAEQQPFQACKTNVIGVMNVLEESFDSKPEFLVLTSTDKTRQVSGVYGATKLIDERLMVEAQGMNPSTKYRTVLYGNVIKSTGSFLTKWEHKMKNGEEICITDPEMTRFFWSRDDAINLIFECLSKATDATPWIPEMKGISIGNALKACQLIWGNKSPVKIIGNRGGENIHESLGNGVFSNTCEQWTVEEFSKFL